MKRISEVIGQEYKGWRTGDLVFIDAGTGTGKSYFIENTLDEYCIDKHKNILYLTNRDVLKEQVKKDIGGFTKITVLNYQEVESFILHNVNFSNFDYVVMDEAHYFFTDSSFSIKTDLFFKRMLEDKSICKVLMTATPIIIKNYFEKHSVKIDYTYELETDYSYLDKITAFNTYESIDTIIKSIREDEQILLFSSAKRALEISQKYHGAFICSKHNEDGLFEDYVVGTDNEEERKSIIENEEFKNHLLCCTTALDNGINLKQFSQLKHIIVDILDRDTFLQVLGRRRIGKGEKINLYFYSYKNDNKRINGFRSKIANSLDRADYLLDNGEIEYVRHKFKNERFIDTRIIDDVVGVDGKLHKQVNECIYEKYKTDLTMYNAILDKKVPVSFKNIIACQLKINGDDIFEMEVENKVLNTEEMLESLVDKRLYKGERDELAEFIGLKDARGRLQKSIGQLNEYLKANKINYMIISKRVKENNKLNIVWIVEKLIIV